MEADVWWIHSFWFTIWGGREGAAQDDEDTTHTIDMPDNARWLTTTTTMDKDARAGGARDADARRHTNYANYLPALN